MAQSLCTRAIEPHYVIWLYVFANINRQPMTYLLPVIHSAINTRKRLLLHLTLLNSLA